MKRCNINLKDDQHKRLEGRAQADDTSISSIVRKAVDLYFNMTYSKREKGIDCDSGK